MKKFGIAVLTIFATGALTLAGLDSDMKQPLPPGPCDFTWTGFYLGAHIGYGWGTGDTSFEGLPTPAAFFFLANQSLGGDADGIFGGGQFGYNYQWSKLVFGFETDFSGADFDGTKYRNPIPAVNGGTFGGTLSAPRDTDWFGTVRGRFGFTPMCKLLLYGTGGLAYGHTHYSGDTAFASGGASYFGSADETSVGWTAGGGLEYAIAKHWTVKAEYLYIDFGSKSFNGTANFPPFGVHYDSQAQEHTVNVGLNYKF